MENAKARWIVNVLGNPDDGAWEISVVRENNSHGIASYGWYDDDKLRVSDSGGVVRHPLAPGLGPVMVGVAERLAEQLNREGK